MTTVSTILASEDLAATASTNLSSSYSFAPRLSSLASSPHQSLSAPQCYCSVNAKEWMLKRTPFTSKPKVSLSPAQLRIMVGEADNESPSEANAASNLLAGINFTSLIQAINTNTTARTNPRTDQNISTLLTPFDESYLGQHGHTKLTQQQFMMATSCPKGEKPLDMICSNSAHIVRRLKSALWQGNFDGPANQFYTAGTGTV